MKLYIVRHGQTDYNIDNKVCGISDVELTSLGKQQAKMASEQLKDISLDIFEGDFVASFDSLYRGTPSLFSLESIEPSEVVSIKKEDFYHKIGSNLSLRLLYEEKTIERFSFYQHLFLSCFFNLFQKHLCNVQILRCCDFYIFIAAFYHH